MSMLQILSYPHNPIKQVPTVYDLQCAAKV